MNSALQGFLMKVFTDKYLKDAGKGVLRWRQDCRAEFPPRANTVAVATDSITSTPLKARGSDLNRRSNVDISHNLPLVPDGRILLLRDVP